MRLQNFNGFVITPLSTPIQPRVMLLRMVDPISDDGIYDFASDDTPPPRPRTVLTSAPPNPAGSPFILSYRPPAADKATGPVEIEQIKNLYLPLWLLGGGIAVRVLASILFTHHIGQTLVELSADLTVGTGVMLLAMLIASKLLHFQLGKLPVAACKLAAITVAPAAVAEFLAPVARFLPFGGIGCWVIEFIMYFALLGALFDLDESDTWYCVLIVLVVRVGITLLWAGLLH
jgi:hypothetical protein